MFRDVYQSFLCDAEQSVLDLCSQSRRGLLTVYSNWDSAALRELVSIPAQRCHKAIIVQYRWPQISHYVAYSFSCLINQR